MGQYQPSGIQPEPASGSQVKWYHRKWFVILMLFLFFPVGLVLLWMSPETRLSGRIVWTALVALAVVVNLSQGEDAPPATGDEITAPSASVAQPSSGSVTVAPQAPEPAPKAQEPVQPREPQWNTSDLDAVTNGNLMEAVRWLKTKEPSWVRSTADASVEPSLAMKAPWKYYGTPLALTGTVVIAQAYPPGSDVGQVVGGDVSEIVMMADDGTVVDFMMIGDSGDINVGNVATVFGVVVGQVEVPNKLGGQTTQLMVVGNAIEGM